MNYIVNAKTFTGNTIIPVIAAGNHLISVIIFFKTDQQRKTKAITSRFAKYLDNVPGSDPVILVSLHYIRDEENLVLAIIKVANLKPLFNNKMPGNVHCMLQCRVFPDFPKGKGAGKGGGVHFA